MEELIITVSDQSANVKCVVVVSISQLHGSAEEGIQSNTISCRAEAGPCRRDVYQLVFNCCTEYVL